MKNQPKPQPTTKKEKSRQKIMHCAKGLFEREGIEHVTFDKIAKAADMCRTTVFNHFAGTSDLMLALTTEEIQDIVLYCRERDLKGMDLIYGLYDKLIEDTAYYPSLTTKLINNAILCNEQENPVKVIEVMTEEGLKEAGKKDTQSTALLIESAYYGLINTYHINNKAFEAETMKREFHGLLGRLV